MSTMLQISLGLIPAILLILVVTLINRKMLIRRLITLVLLAAVSITGVVIHTQNRAEIVENSTKDSAKSVELVYALMATGDTQGAEELLDQLLDTTVYVEDYALCQARLNVLGGDYTAAKMLYKKAMDAGLSGDDVAAEYDMVCRSFAPVNVDLPLLQHNPNYAPDAEDADAIATQVSSAKLQAVQLVQQAVQQIADNIGKTILEAAGSIQQAETLYQQYLNNAACDLEQAAAIIKQLNTVEKKHPVLFAQSILRETRLKMQLVVGDYEAVAKSVTEQSGYKELMVVSELYINGYITEKNFSKTYGKDGIEVMEAVLEHLETVYRTHFREESSATRRKVKDYIDSLEYAIKNPALAQMQEDLKQYAQHYNAVDGSKVYMQLANLSYYQGNETAADKHLTDSFGAVGNCQDESFTGPMFAVIDAINNKQDTESLKQVSAYVEQIMENSTVMQMHEAVRVPNPDQEKPEEEEPKPGFDTFVSDYASQKRASVSIVNLNADNFSEVVLEICVDGDLAYSASELKNILQIKDCGAEITDFTVEELSYDQVNIILVCDTSGSMDGSAIYNLKETVRRFISDKSSKERIGLVTFSSYVEDVYGLDASVEELNAAVESIRASGGTAIYDAMCYAVTMIGADQDALNVILLMSDGQDNSPGSVEEIQQNVCKPCTDQGVVIYPIGLGSGVDSEYLARFATGTGGSYLYVNDDATLEGTYEYLHNLLSTRYRITYQAVDTMTNDRQVQVSIKGDDLSYDIRQYSLGKEENQTEQEIVKDKYVTGLDTRVLFKTKTSQNVNLMVSGFEESDKVTVKLYGDLNYDLTCKRISDSKYQLTIPSNIAVGVYDLQVKVNDGTVYLANELTVGIEESTTRFGSYNFTAYIRKTNGNTTTLAGNVCLNGWLYFDGTITLTGDLQNDATITMRDTDGSHIVYSKDNATGLAKYLAEKGKNVELPALGNVMLYDGDYLTGGTDDYSVDSIILPTFYLARMFYFDGPTLYLYPDSFKLQIVDVTTKFPFQEQLLSSNGVKDIFNFDVESTLTLTNQTVGLYINVELDPESFETGNNNSTPVKTGNMPLSIGLDEFALTIDTVKNEYYVKFLTELNFLKVKGAGIALRWSGSFVPQEARIYCDFDLNTNISGVPVTFSDFELAMMNIDPNKSPFYWTYEGATKISVAKVSAVMPGLEKYLGDASVAALDKATLTLSLGEKYVKMSTDVKLFGEIKVGSVLIECGKIPYTNALLRMYDQEIAGMRAKVTKGLFWNSHNCDIELSGSLELALSNKVLGGTVEGVCDVEVEWWIFKKSVDIRGAAFVGMYQDHSGDYIFTVRASNRDEGGKRGINITWSKRYGSDVDTKFY